MPLIQRFKRRGTYTDDELLRDLQLLVIDLNKEILTLTQAVATINARLLAAGIPL